MLPNNNKEKKGGGGKNKSSRSSSSAQAFPTGDFGAHPDLETPDGVDRSATGQWQTATSTRVRTDDKTPEELIAMCAPHEKLRETSDPEAVAHLEADALFSAGIRCGRHGDLAGAKAQIASAFLLDDRCLHVSTIPYTPSHHDLYILHDMARVLYVSDVDVHTLPRFFSSPISDVNDPEVHTTSKDFFKYEKGLTLFELGGYCDS